MGAGLAGLTVALQLADRHRIVVLAKRGFEEAATAWAQGGIVGVIGDDDSVELHVHDTQVAGGGLVDENTARFVAENSGDVIRWLVDQGVPFTTDPAGPLGLHLTREGGHAVRRIAHAADATGRAIHEALLERAHLHPNITMRERWMAVDVITSRHLRREEPTRAYGVYALDLDAGRVETLPASAVVLATGGVGKVYRYTTNPDTSTGDGIAMAWRAGCRVANMEFVQFHPTCLYHPEERTFLISEALRGEGAYLELPDGTRFMAAHDPRMELAPRDIVARAIDFEMKKHGLDNVWLDARHSASRSCGSTSPHPPPVHGARDRHRDAADPRGPGGALHVRRRGHRPRGPDHVPGLYAVGETTYTGLHGANRLASNRSWSASSSGGPAPSASTRIAERGHGFPDRDESRVEIRTRWSSFP